MNTTNFPQHIKLEIDMKLYGSQLSLKQITAATKQFYQMPHETKHLKVCRVLLDKLYNAASAHNELLKHEANMLAKETFEKINTEGASK